MIILISVSGEMLSTLSKGLAYVWHWLYLFMVTQFCYVSTLLILFLTMKAVIQQFWSRPLLIVNKVVETKNLGLHLHWYYLDTDWRNSLSHRLQYVSFWMHVVYSFRHLKILDNGKSSIIVPLLFHIEYIMYFYEGKFLKLCYTLFIICR